MLLLSKPNYLGCATFNIVKTKYIFKSMRAPRLKWEHSIFLWTIIITETATGIHPPAHNLHDSPFISTSTWCLLATITLVFPDSLSICFTSIPAWNFLLSIKAVQAYLQDQCRVLRNRSRLSRSVMTSSSQVLFLLSETNPCWSKILFNRNLIDFKLL